jgi:hypothetical protein
MDAAMDYSALAINGTSNASRSIKIVNVVNRREAIYYFVCYFFMVPRGRRDPPFLTIVNKVAAK